MAQCGIFVTLYKSVGIFKRTGIKLLNRIYNPHDVDFTPSLSQITVNNKIQLRRVPV